MLFQQYTGAVMAKSLEDTLFYRYHRVIDYRSTKAQIEARKEDYQGSWLKLIAACYVPERKLKETITNVDRIVDEANASRQQPYLTWVGIRQSLEVLAEQLTA